MIISTRTQLERSGEPPPVCFNYAETPALPASPRAAAAAQSTLLQIANPINDKKQTDVLYKLRMPTLLADLVE